MIAVAMDAWRVNEQGEPFEELERSERESRGTIRCGMGKTIDDALASGRTVAGSLDPFEGEWRTSTVAQKTFESCTVTGRDVNRRIDAEPAGGLPSEHVIGDVAFEQTVAVEVPEHAVANGLLELIPVGGREMGGLVELDRAQGILAEHAVDDTDVEMEVSVERRAEAMKKRDRADLGMGTGSRARMSERSANGPQEDAQHSAGDRGVVVQEGPDALRHGEHPLTHGKWR